MLDVPPREPRWLSWLYVLVASLVLFATVPFARAIQKALAQHTGEELFLYITIAIGAAALIAMIRILRRRRISQVGYLWLLGVGIAFAAYAYSLSHTPIETIHLLEYGLLSLLVYRALVHRVRDVSIYPIAILIVGIVGFVDEWLQWITPSRFWDLRDVRVNVAAGALMQLAIAAGLRPTLVAGWPSPRNVARLCMVAAVGVFLIGLSFANTPERIASFAARYPSYSFLLDSRSMMAEYGYLYEDPDIGIFRSRFTQEELAEYDRDRGLEVAAAFDRYIDDDMHGEFFDVYTVPRDAYMHEAGVHLFRRNRYLENAGNDEQDRGEHYNVAHRENRILEKYFPTGLHNSGHVWGEALRKRVEELADTEPDYVSPVGRAIITRASEAQILTGFGVAVVALLLTAAFCYKRDDSTLRSARVSEGGNE